MDRSDIAKFVAMIAAFGGMVNVTITPERQELLIALLLAITTVVPLAYAMLKKDPVTGVQAPKGSKQESTVVKKKTETPNAV